MVEPDDVTRTKSETVLWTCLLRNHTLSQTLLFLLLCFLQPRLSPLLLIPGMLLKGTCRAMLLQKLQIQLLNSRLPNHLKLTRNVLEFQLKGSNLPDNLNNAVATETLFVVSFLYFGFVHFMLLLCAHSFIFCAILLCWFSVFLFVSLYT